MKRPLLLLALLALALVVGALGWQAYRDRYVEERRDGEALAGVVTAAFTGRTDLRVGTVSGTVQSRSTDTRGFGLLNTEQVVKAPYSVDYFLDLSRLSLDDYAWDAEARVLTVELPPVTVGRANVDEGARTLVETRGPFVTRGAGETLSRRASARAQALAQAKAQEPEQIAKARERARAVVPGLLRPALVAAGLEDVRVVAAFPEDRPPTEGDRWDVTRSLQDVLADPKYR